MTSLPRDTILDAIQASLDGFHRRAQPAMFFLQRSGQTVFARPAIPLPDEVLARAGSAGAALAEFVRAICGDPSAPDRMPPGLYCLCLYSEARPVDAASGGPFARAFTRHVWATDPTGDIYHVWQSRRGSQPQREVMAESDGWSGIQGMIPDALRRFAVAFLDAPAHLAPR
jgi:hypothetical protein